MELWEGYTTLGLVLKLQFKNAIWDCDNIEPVVMMKFFINLFFFPFEILILYGKFSVLRFACTLYLFFLVYSSPEEKSDELYWSHSIHHHQSVHLLLNNISCKTTEAIFFTIPLNTMVPWQKFPVIIIHVNGKSLLTPQRSNFFSICQTCSDCIYSWLSVSQRLITQILLTQTSS